ncbi:ribonuclease H [Rhodoferax koreense]|uniref:Ribonuclease H n=1 Tax=Rhodoferax koreensis TaxID=1842727 RepID=A0A1P8JYQ9_9BURK|nr:ribonuclease HI family protein [Rhodoferax koreense]APW38884.1 ribonuclease H [Rhodoferax koreense]
MARAPGPKTRPFERPLPPNAWTAYCDGSAMPNPGRIGLGAVITAPDGARHTLSQAAAERGCNNEAEVRALTAALLALKSMGADVLRVHCDNSVVVAQLGGGAAKPIARLAHLFDEARALLVSFRQAEVVWIPQHLNSDADGLARAALGIAAPRTVKASKRRGR